MRATELLSNQMRMIHGRISGLGTLTTNEWMARPAYGGNQIGFTAWHMVATRDWTVRSILQGKRMLGWDAPFAGTGVALCELPLGMPQSEADAIAAAVSPAQVVEYSAAVSAELDRWLAGISDDVLGSPPSDASAHFALSPRFSERPYRHQLEEDPDDMKLWPVWTWLTRPCFMHCLGHLGEIEAARRTP